MTFSLTQILVFIVAYLSILFAIGYLADRGHIPHRLVNHPVVYVLSLGVFSGALGIFGASELALDYGNSFLVYYIGVVLMFLLSPLILYPVLRVCSAYQLSSLADLLTFRFRSRWVGTAITLAMLATMLPLLALQIQAVSDAIRILYDNQDYLLPGSGRHDVLALFFCAVIMAFTMLFGTPSDRGQQRHYGLIAAIAFESLTKLLALLGIGGFAIYSVFGGLAGLQEWLQSSPQILQLLHSPLREDSSRALLLIFFAGAVAMPHMFHMTVTEYPGDGALKAASWGLPLYLLLLSLPILPITWAALKLGSAVPTAYSILAIGLEQNSISLATLAFAAGLSASSAVIIVSTLAMANMCMNHLLLPLQLRSSSIYSYRSNDLYQQLRWLRRVLVGAIILAGYLFSWLMEARQSLVDLGLVTFVGTLQFLPGILATIYWAGANRKGLLMGLAGGFGVWFFTLLLPLVSDYYPHFTRYFYLIWFDDLESLWSAATIGSLTLNVGLFILVSVTTRTSQEERRSAELCSPDDLSRPMRRALDQSNPEEFKTQLATELGEVTANAEVERALQQLDMAATEDRPFALRRLRAQIGANLSGMLGPTVAREIIQRCITWQPHNLQGPEDISLIESSLDTAQFKFTGLAADLNNLRRYHRETLRELPVGVLSLGPDGEVLMWNNFMEQITGVRAEQVIGSYLRSLPYTWSKLLQDFAGSEQATAHQLQLPEAGPDGGDNTSRWISMHKANIESSSPGSEDQVIVVEDVSDTRLLEQELLHSERLASVGRLAAGVAHEIGNPVTGIACLAQNLEYEEDVAEARVAAAEILKQTDRVTRIVESLVNFSHTGNAGGEENYLSAVNLADCVDEAIHLLTLDHSAKPVDFINHCDREHLVRADGQKLLQVFINLLSNARDASDEKAQVEIDSRCDNQHVITTVTDWGCGIAETIQGQVFEPFFTTKDPGAGTGLGLSLVYNILDDMRGRISLCSPLPGEVNRGTEFRLQLDRAEYREEYL